MRFLRGLLRVYSWIFETLVCLLGIGVAIVSWSVGASDPVSIDWLPWSAATLPAWLTGLGVLGLIFVGLALFGRYRFLFFVFAAAVFVLVTKGLFFSTHSFESPNEGQTALYIVLASFLALLGAWPARSKNSGYRSR